jgi:hypothetical protein
MTVPASYTEKTLAVYMQTQLGKVATVLALTAGASSAGDFEEAVNDTLLAYGTTDISTISGVSNIQKLRVLAKMTAWQFVVNNFAALYDFSADGGSYHRSQLFEQSKQALKMAETAALPYDAVYQVKIIPVDHTQNLYRYRPEEETDA